MEVHGRLQTAWPLNQAAGSRSLGTHPGESNAWSLGSEILMHKHAGYGLHCTPSIPNDKTF